MEPESRDFLKISPNTAPHQLGKMGVIPGGKIDNQLLMLRLGLPIPEGRIFSASAFDNNSGTVRLKPKYHTELINWLNKFPDKSFQIRCDGRSTIADASTIRFLPTLQDLTSKEVIPGLESLFVGLPKNRLVIIQAVPVKGMERDIHSVQILYNPYTHRVIFEIRHDIATILAREGGFPDETFSLGLDELLHSSPRRLLQFALSRRKILTPPQLLSNFHFTLMRFGRLEIERVTQVKIPKIELLLHSLKKNISFLSKSKLLDQSNLDNLITLAARETAAFHQSGFSLKDFGFPEITPEKLTLGGFLTLLGFFHLGNFTKLRAEHDQYHTMKIRLNNLLAKDSNFGYRHPTEDDYLELIRDTRKLAEAGILQGHRIPKLSIINTPAGHKFVYWDLIPSGYK